MSLSQQACHHPMLATALAAVEEGAIAIRKHFQQSVQIEIKGTSNFVTEADLDSEKRIVNRIRQSFPNHAIISEESHSDRADSEDLWIIDPLDGTSNFMHGIPHFAISLAYYHQGQPKVGIVCNPIRNDLYVAVLDQGAWHNGVRQKVDQSARLDQVVVCCGFYYDRDRMMQATLDTLGDFFRQNVHGMRRFGAAALDLCNLGCGHYGLFFEYKLHPWDYAAGQLFVTEAGGHVTDCTNQLLPLGRPSSICATNGLLHQQSLAIISSHWNKLSQPQ
jgi:myo-inositol-1(or 4)-monophosphatase